MIVDSSAVVAILLKEAEGLRLLRAITEAWSRAISAANVLETHLVMDGRGRADEVDGFLADAKLEIRPVTLDHLALARTAHDRYGRGNHPAKLNFGDCFAYALAKATRQPLLFKGNDFSQTDIVSALY